MNDEEIIKFPCEFPIKIMGLATSKLEEVALPAIQKHAPDADKNKLKFTESKNGKYVSITVTITATSKDQLDNIYLDLSKIPEVLMVL